MDESRKSTPGEALALDAAVQVLLDAMQPFVAVNYPNMGPDGHHQVKVGTLIQVLLHRARTGQDGGCQPTDVLHAIGTGLGAILGQLPPPLVAASVGVVMGGIEGALAHANAPATPLDS